MRCLCLAVAAVTAGLSAAAPPAFDPAQFQEPGIKYWPRTRWWWMGNALRKSDITWQLEQMHAHGIGGVEQITMQPVYEKGNVPYLSDAYFDLARHAVTEAERLGMQVSFNFGGPGWIFGGDWVPEADRNVVLMASWQDLDGPTQFSGPLPRIAAVNPNDHRSLPEIPDDAELVAVVTAQADCGQVNGETLTVRNAASDSGFEWDVPEGTWRIMAFWLVPTGGNTVNHLDRDAMRRYCDHVGGAYREALGGYFGTTIDSFFSDSFEVEIHRNGLYWTRGLLDAFRDEVGYDLTPLLPLLWWDAEPLSAQVRYDVNAFLHRTGMRAFFDPFLEWCEANGVQGRIQPYGFVTDVLEGAGRAHLPELEITAGEKDAVPWFDNRIGPKKYVASGARLYGRPIVTVEAYTYLHWDPYRATLEELKLASDIFLRAGANRFYNHGYTASPERDIAPSRGFYAAIHISHDNVWWSHYPHLADYIARSCYLLQHSRPVADVAVYSPLANQWTQDALNARRWTRDFDWGDLGELLIGNGYDFDLINDDALQRLARFDGPTLAVGENTYRILLLPNIQAIPVASYERIREYALGGGVVMALEQTPINPTGRANWDANRARVEEISRELFRNPAHRDDTAPHPVGKGQTHHIRTVLDRSDVLDRRSTVLDPFVNALRGHLLPDFGLDFAKLGWRRNPGLTFAHHEASGHDLYFVTNIHDAPMDVEVAFRVTGKRPAQWDPHTGAVRPLLAFRDDGARTTLPLRLAPYASTYIVFEPGAPAPHMTRTNAVEIREVRGTEVVALTNRNGRVYADTPQGTAAVVVDDVPAPFEVAGTWDLVLESDHFPRHEMRLTELVSWTDDKATRHFSGTGRYTIAFDLPEAYASGDVELQLDLGDVGDVAEVSLNGQHVGVRWMRGQTLDVTEAAQPGRNTLRVAVTNTLINRVAGLEALPGVPEDLEPIFGRGIADESSPARRLLGFPALPRSGLLGPVVIRPHRVVSLPYTTEER